MVIAHWLSCELIFRVNHIRWFEEEKREWKPQQIINLLPAVTTFNVSGHKLNITMAPSAVPVDDATPLQQTLPLNGSEKHEKTLSVQLQDAKMTDLVVRTFRCLIADLCEQFKGGHPG